MPIRRASTIEDRAASDIGGALTSVILSTAKIAQIAFSVAFGAVAANFRAALEFDLRFNEIRDRILAGRAGVVSAGVRPQLDNLREFVGSLVSVLREILSVNREMLEVWRGICTA